MKPSSHRLLASLVPVWIGCLALCGACVPDASSTSTEEGGQQQAGREYRPPFPMYLGKPVEPIRGETRIESTPATVVLERALQGDVVHHDFVIRNDGASPMSLENVTACTGCILDGHTREIAPGRTGRISIVIPTDPLGGQTVQGVVTAETSDPDRPRIEIEVTLEVAEFAALDPYRVWLEGAVGEPIVARCRVVPNASYPFEIVGIKARKGAWFDWEFEATTHEGRPAWEITLTNTRAKPGPYQDVLFIQTDHPARPELKVRVEGRIAPAP